MPASDSTFSRRDESESQRDGGNERLQTTALSISASLVLSFFELIDARFQRPDRPRRAVDSPRAALHRQPADDGHRDEQVAVLHRRHVVPQLVEVLLVEVPVVLDGPHRRSPWAKAASRMTNVEPRMTKHE